jgi:hypothetical protein
MIPNTCGSRLPYAMPFTTFLGFFFHHFQPVSTGLLAGS